MISDIFVLFLCNACRRSLLIVFFSFIFFLLSVFLLIRCALLLYFVASSNSMQAECTGKNGGINTLHTFVPARWRLDKQLNWTNMLGINEGGRSKREYVLRWLMPTNKTTKTKKKIEKKDWTNDLMNMQVDNHKTFHKQIRYWRIHRFS